MALRPLTQYGRILRAYHGYGQLLAESGGDIAPTCRVNLAQISDGRIYGHFAIRGSVVGIQEVRTLKQGVLKGVTDAGAELEATRVYLTSTHWGSFASGEIMLAGVCGQLTVKNCAVAPGEREFHYGLTNVELGLECSCSFEIEGKEVELRPIDYYKEVIADLKASRGIEVTCELVLRESDLEHADDIALSVCWLLGLVCGTYITWVYRDTYLEHRIVETFCHRPRTRPFCTRRLIPLSVDNDPLADFVEQTYASYVKAVDKFRLPTIIALFQEERLTTDLEAEIMYGAIALDALQNLHMAAQQEQHIFDLECFSKSQRRKIWEEMRDAVAQAVSQALAKHGIALTAKQDETLRDKVPELARVSFRTGLKSLFDTLGVDHTSQDLHFIEERNAIIHTGVLRSKKPKVSFELAARLDDLLACTLLSILNYRGPYLDYTGSRAVIRTFDGRQQGGGNKKN